MDERQESMMDRDDARPPEPGEGGARWCPNQCGVQLEGNRCPKCRQTCHGRGGDPPRSAKRGARERVAKIVDDAVELGMDLYCTQGAIVRCDDRDAGVEKYTGQLLALLRAPHVSVDEGGDAEAERRALLALLYDTYGEIRADVGAAVNRLALLRGPSGEGEATAWLREWQEAVLEHYPPTWAFDPVQPRVMVANVVRAARSKAQAEAPHNSPEEVALSLLDEAEDPEHPVMLHELLRQAALLIVNLHSEAPELPVTALNELLQWLDTAGGDTPVSDDAIVKLTDAAGRPITHVTAEWWRGLLAAVHGVQFGNCPNCGEPWAEHVPDEMRVCHSILLRPEAQGEGLPIDDLRFRGWLHGAMEAVRACDRQTDANGLCSCARHIGGMLRQAMHYGDAVIEALSRTAKESDEWRRKYLATLRSEAQGEDELHKALRVATRWIVEGEPEIGWTVDRLREVLAARQTTCTALDLIEGQAVVVYRDDDMDVGRTWVIERRDGREQRGPTIVEAARAEAKPPCGCPDFRSEAQGEE